MEPIAPAVCSPAIARFFFQAEDGIRDWSVTGVQTCALRSCCKRAIACRRGNRLGNGRHVNNARVAYHVERKLCGRQAAGGRPRTQITEGMAALTMRHEIDAGGCGPIDRDASRIDVFVFPQGEKHPSERVVADPRDVARMRAKPGGSNRHVRRVTAETLQIGMRIVGVNLIEFDERLAERDDLGTIIHWCTPTLAADAAALPPEGE